MLAATATTLPRSSVSMTVTISDAVSFDEKILKAAEREQIEVA